MSHNDEPDTMLAILIDPSVTVVEISRDKPDDDIARLVGDPLFARLRHLSTVDFWVGDNSLATSPPNPVAARILASLLADIATGDHPTSGHDRAHAQRLLAAGTLPAIHGPCLITGVNDTGDDPGALEETFRDWFAHTLLRHLANDAAEIVTTAQAIAGNPAVVNKVTLAIRLR